MTVGNPVHRRTTVASTNDEARTLALQGAAHGTAVLAAGQTRGRGTKGRTWHSPPGLGLYVSFVLRGPAGGPVPFPHILPLAVGLAAAEAVREAAGLRVGLKWPNDLVHEGRKLGGILCEAVTGAADAGFAVAGVGLNVGHGPEDLPEAIRPLATSLRMAGRPDADVESLFAGLCRALDSWYNVLARGDRGSVLEAFEAAMVPSPGTPVRVATAAGGIMGTCRGLDAEGRLVIERDGGAGTVSFDAVLGLEAIV
jgi:BirA family biotin operon repressor/biotin-[acetyl-CoA-carboxylase] ligase